MKKNLPHSWGKKNTKVQSCLLPAGLRKCNLEKNGNHVTFVFLGKVRLDNSLEEDRRCIKKICF